MSFIKNIKTGITTECINKDVIKVCKADPLNYIVEDSLEALLLSESSEEKTVLTDIKITTKDDEYIISGKENKKEATITFTKIGNYRLKDEDGNIYSLQCRLLDLLLFLPFFSAIVKKQDDCKGDEMDDRQS